MQSLFNQQFSTDRLELCQLNAKDSSFIQTLTNSEGWLEFIGDREIRSELAAVAYIQKIEDLPKAKYWKVVEKCDQQAIGVITLIKRDYLEDYDIGYAFLPDSFGQGYAFEATEVILKKALEKSASGSIYAVTKVTNLRSINLLTKLGFENIKSINPDGDEVDLFAIAKS